MLQMEEPWRWHSYYSVSSQSSSVLFQDALQQRLPVSTTTQKKADWFLTNPLSSHSFSFSVSSGATLNHRGRLWQKKPRLAPCLVATVCVTMQPPITCPTTFRHQCEQKGRQKFAQCDLYSAGFHLLHNCYKHLDSVVLHGCELSEMHFRMLGPPRHLDPPPLLQMYFGVLF